MVAIIGAGIGGLAIAQALQKHGIEYRIFEKATVFAKVGAGIWLAPNALQALSTFGLLEGVTGQGNELKKFGIMTQSIDDISANELNVVKEKFGVATIAIHRARLHEVLMNGLPANAISLGFECNQVIEKEDRCEIEFANGERFICDHIIAADGIYSKVRSSIFPKAQIRDSQQICWRGVAKPRIPENFKHTGYELWGDGVRFGFSPINKEEVYWFAVAKDDETKNKDIGPTKEYLLNRFSSFHPFVLELLNTTQSESIHQNKIEDLKPMNKWYSDRVLFVGDAGHATTPNMGQGGAQALEDAYVIHALLKTMPLNTHLFQKFQSHRSKKVNEIVSTSWQIGKMAHWRVGKRLRNFILKQTPKSIVEKRLLRLYTLDLVE